MSSFTTTFGNSPVSPADVAYAAYSFSTSLTLYWPQFSQGQANVAARFMNMTVTAGGLNVYMPDATLNSVGYDAIVFNAGSTTFNVVTYGSTAIVTIAPGQTYYLMLNSNTTQNGGWQTVQFGVGTGSAVASALAGAGLLAASGLLEVNLNGIMVSSSYTISTTQRAILQVWNGGTGTITLPTAASVGNGFFFPLANNGSGSVTVATSGSDQIDGATTSIFSQTQSGFILSTGTSWITVGKGIQNTFAVTLLNLNVAGSSDVTLTSAQAQNTIQQYTGVLLANINVIVPNTVQIYYVYNNTNGAFTLTVKTATGSGVQVTQGQHAILYCDGTNVVNAFTAAISSTIGIISGSSVSPSIFVQGSSSTGIYSPAANQIAVTANGFEVANFISSGMSVNYLQVSATATGNAPAISAMGSDANIGIILSPKGSGAVGMASAVILGGLIDNTVIGSATPAAITGTTITANTGFVGNLTGNVTGNITGTAPAGTLTGTTLAANVVASSLTSVGTIAVGIWNGTIIAVANGGTGLATLTANNVILGNGTSTPTFVAPSTSGNVLTSNGTTWQSTAIPSVISVPSGALMPFAGSSAPSGYLLCFGQAISRTTFASLFSAIGTAWGIGDGTTTFNIPDLRGYVPAGIDNMGGSAAGRLTSTTMTPDGQTLGATGGTQTHTNTSGELASHTHTASVSDPGHSHTTFTFPGVNLSGGPSTVPGTPNSNHTFSTDTASTGISVNNANTGSGTAYSILQPTVAINYIIKT